MKWYPVTFQSHEVPRELIIFYLISVCESVTGCTDICTVKGSSLPERAAMSLGEQFLTLQRITVALSLG